MGIIILLIIGSLILCQIIIAIIEENKRSIRNNVMKEVLKNFDIQKQKEEIISINNNFVPKEMRCSECKGILVHHIGKFGEFWGCSNFPNCRFTKTKL